MSNWLCHTCQVEIPLDEVVCGTCGSGRNVLNWRCKCGFINTSAICEKCGTQKANVILERMLRERLLEPVGKDGRPAIEYIISFAYAFGRRRRIPESVVEEGLGEGLLVLVRKHTVFDAGYGRATFATWASSIIKHEILHAAKKSVNEPYGIQIDATHEDGTPILESLVVAMSSDGLGEELEFMREFARSALGAVYDSKAGIERPLYDVLLEEFAVSPNEYIMRSSWRTNMTAQAISQRLSRTRKAIDKIARER